MRVVIAVLVMLSLPFSVSANPCDMPNPAFAGVPGRVNVTLRAGKVLKATIVCADADTLVVIDGTRVRHVPLADVLRVVKPRDSILNGFAIGAGIGLVFLASGPGERRYAPDYTESRYRNEMLRLTLVLGGIGAAFDALHGSDWNVYTAPPQPMSSSAIQWRTRF